MHVLKRIVHYIQGTLDHGLHLCSLFSLIQMMIGVGVWIPDALHQITMCFLMII